LSLLIRLPVDLWLQVPHNNDMYTQPKYMDHTHPDAFVDWAKRSPEYGMTKECPRCKGYGGWNLQLNAYKLREGMADTQDTRHLFCHFRQHCGTCNGWGYVHPNMNCTGHDWVFVQNLGRCYNRYKCKHCDAISDVDSSD